MEQTHARRLLLELFNAAIEGADGRHLVAGILRDCGPRQIAAFAIGKAASSMMLGALDGLGERLASAFVVTKDGHLDPELRRLPQATLAECAHPVPDERSLAAGAELERRIRALSADTYPVFLISGGSSSLIESLHDGVSLADLRELNQRGLAAGWDITRLNAERSRLSRLKGGGVVRLLGQRDALALFISDVPGDDPDLIGSGLLGHDAARPDQVVRVVVANIGSTVAHVIEVAKAHGLHLESRARFDGDAAEVAARFVAALRASDADGLVWGGESTVALPENPGRGGRNTHLALAAARLLHADEALTILAAGTDGTDGPTEDAGAIVDSGTVARAELSGVDVELGWRNFDSGTVLEAAEDLLHTGPTGTNVGDILIGVKHARGRVRDRASSRVLKA